MVAERDKAVINERETNQQLQELKGLLVDDVTNHNLIIHCQQLPSVTS